MTSLNFTNQIFKEGETFVAYSPEFDISSCGLSINEARDNLKEALVGFLESARDRGVLEEILSEAGFLPDQERKQWQAPELLVFEKSQVSFS